MNLSRFTLPALVVAAMLPLAACAKQAIVREVEHASTVEDIPGSLLKKVTLTERATERLNVKTVEVRAEGGESLVPYSALIYDFNGKTWVYTSPSPRTFVREEVEIDRIVADVAVLKSGPAVGTQVASLAVAELYGTEFAVGH